MKNKGFRSFTQVLKYIIKYFKWVLAFAAVLIVLSGIYVVDSHEVAVVLRFGRLVGRTPQEQIREPGLHFALPFFIDEVIRVPVHTIHEREIYTHYSRDRIPFHPPLSGYLLTGDNNIVLVEAIARYQITDVARYVLFSRDAGDMIDGIISGELTRVVTTMYIDYVLTAGRAELGPEIMRSSQAILDEMDIGVTIISLELLEILPPRETLWYFEAVRSAAVESETRVQMAREEAQSWLFSAQATASAVRQEAVLEQNRRLSDVRNEMAEFDGVYGQFVTDPEIIMAGVFRQRIARILSNAGNVIILPDGDVPPMIVLP